jgi:two-component system response regulator PhoP
MRILVVEDELKIQRLVSRQFESAGCAVQAVGTGREALYYATEYVFDALILDLGLPEMNGLEVIRRLREQDNRIPILALTARGRWQDRVVGLEAGADDYLPKPFRMEELAARVGALVRRATGLSPQLDWGGFQLDLERQILRQNGVTVELTTMEYRLLEYLARRRGRVVSKTELRDHLYPDDRDPDSNVIEVVVARLRRKLDPDGAAQPIETLRGRGYRLDL